MGLGAGVRGWGWGVGFGLRRGWGHVARAVEVDALLSEAARQCADALP